MAVLAGQSFFRRCPNVGHNLPPAAPGSEPRGGADASTSGACHPCAARPLCHATCNATPPATERLDAGRCFYHSVTIQATGCDVNPAHRALIAAVLHEKSGGDGLWIVAQERGAHMGYLHFQVMAATQHATPGTLTRALRAVCTPLGYNVRVPAHSPATRSTDAPCVASLRRHWPRATPPAGQSVGVVATSWNLSQPVFEIGSTF